MDKKELIKLAIISYMSLILLSCITLAINLLIVQSYLQYIDKKIIDIYYNKIIIADSWDFFDNICKHVSDNPKVLPNKPNKLMDIFNDTKIMNLLLK